MPLSKTFASSGISQPAPSYNSRSLEPLAAFEDFGKKDYLWIYVILMMQKHFV